MSGTRVGARRSKRGKKTSGFYREALGQREEGAGGKVDVGEIKQRLITAIQRRPGEIHLLLQGSKVLLRAEAMERRSGRGRPEEMLAMMRTLEEELGEQLITKGEG
jgi:hypothetical protein